MVDHDYNYRIDDVAVVDPQRAKRCIIPEIAAGIRHEELTIAFREGAYVSDEHQTDTKVVPMIVDLAGDTYQEIYTSYHNLMEMVYGGKKTLTKLDPVYDNISAEILAAEEIHHGSGAERQRLEIPLLFTRGHWLSDLEDSEVDTGLTTTGSIGPFTPGGTHRTYPKFTITCTAAGDNPSIEEPASGAIIQLAGSFATSDVIVVDVDARLVTLNGVRAKNLLVLSRGYWMRLRENVAHTLTWTATSGTWSVTTAWRDRYR